MKYSNEKHIIYLKRPLVYKDEYKDFIIQNGNYSRFVWNKFVERFKDENIFELDFDDINQFKKDFYYDYEVPNNIYDHICVGISEQVCKNMKHAKKSIIAKIKNGFTHKSLRFHKYDKYRNAFKVHNRPRQSSQTAFDSRIKKMSKYLITFRVSKYDYREFELNEPLYTNVKSSKDGNNTYYDKKNGYKYKSEDIKEVAFLYDCNRLYILLTVNVRYAIYPTDNKLTMCGIDLGIENPVTVCYNDNYDIMHVDMDEDIRAKIKRLEERTKKLQSVMDRKYEINKNRFINGKLDNIYTKNYEKVRYKFRLTHRKIVNIKKHWRNCITSDLCRLFKYMVVDDFRQYTIDNHDTLPKILIHRLNHRAHFIGIYDFNKMLIYKSSRYSCTYLVPPNNFQSTNMCSECKHVNTNKLTIDERTFVCESCGNTLHRDINASINLYRFGKFLLES